MIKVERPQMDKNVKISCKEEFELCYLRHQYVRRVDFNPTEEEMKPYAFIVAHMAKNTFFTYRNLFSLVGFESEDLINIGRVHLVSYLGLFSMEKLPEKYESFSNTFFRDKVRDPNPYDLLNKNKANLTLFLKQRFEDVVRICRQKARNIKGLPTEEFFIFHGPNKPPKILRNLVENHEKYGFKKLDIAVFKSIKKKIKVDNPNCFKLNDTWYVAVPVEHKSLSLTDFSGAGMDPYDSIHNMTPERIFFAQEEDKEWADKREEFNAYSVKRRTRMVKSFIKKNKNKPIYKEELKAARELLKTLGM